MNLCIPIDADRGLESPICGHFGSAPAFMIVDTATGARRVLANENDHHAHGSCVPVGMLQREGIGGAVVAAIGLGALRRLQASSVHVYLADQGTVGAALSAWEAGALQRMQPAQACAARPPAPAPVAGTILVATAPERTAPAAVTRGRRRRRGARSSFERGPRAAGAGGAATPWRAPSRRSRA